MTRVEPTPVTMNLLMVIDTEYLKACYPEPSQDPNSPTGINHHSQFIIATGTRSVLHGQATADLSVKAAPGDAVSFGGAPIFANSDDAVIVYEIKHLSGDQVLRPVPTQAASCPYATIANARDAAPAARTSLVFCRHRAQVARAGTEKYNVCIALYTPTPDGETQKLHGYYSWAPSITVS